MLDKWAGEAVEGHFSGPTAWMNYHGLVREPLARLVGAQPGEVVAMNTLTVNLHLMPAKGMTLPFISYGGSSLVAVALSMGMLLALTRKRPDQTRFVAPIEFSPLPSRG